MTEPRSSSAFAREVGDGWARLVRGAVHGESLLLPGGSLGIGGEAFDEMNWGDVYGPDAAAATDALRAFAGRLRDRGLPGTICVASDVADEARAVAADLGLRSDEDPMPLMACREDQMRPVGARLAAERVKDQGSIPEIADVLGEAFECSPWMCANMLGPDVLSMPDVDLFLTRLEGEIASVVSTVRVGPTVGVYAVGTRPRLRRRGAASSALLTAMEYHFERGAIAFGLHASTDGAFVYERLGFAVLDSVSGWFVDAS